MVAAETVADKLRFALRVMPACLPLTRSGPLLRNLHLRRPDSPGFDAALPLMVAHDHAY